MIYKKGKGNGIEKIEVNGCGLTLTHKHPITKYNKRENLVMHVI